MHVSLSSLLLFCFKRNFLIVHFAQSLPTMIRAIPKNKKPLFCKKTSMEILSYDRSYNKTGRK